jgi:hypothetical protein
LEINHESDTFDSFLQDRNIAITTFAGSHILSSIGSKPTDQTAAIVGNILGGATKLAGIAFGAPIAAGAPAALTKPSCGDVQTAANNVQKYRKQIEKLEADEIRDVPPLEPPPPGTKPPVSVDDATLKKDAAQIQVLQTLMTEEQKKITLTVKGTIDPGFDPAFFASDAHEPPHTGQKPGPVFKDIPLDGLVATIAPTSKELVQKKWLKDLTDKDTNPLEIKVYMDFANSKLYSYVSAVAARHEEFKEPIPQVHVDKPPSDAPENGDLFRAPRYIPVLVWGNKDTKTLVPPDTPDDDADDPDPGPISNGPKQLIAPKTIPFAQYGFTERLPIRAHLFRQIEWAVTFNDFGEVTNATFSSKSWGSTATSLFANAASAASSIAAEQQKAAAANSPSAQAAKYQAIGDEIYEQGRAALCQAHPASCPSK